MTADAVRGWQNVAREILRQRFMLAPRDGEPPLTAVEEAEMEAWKRAERAVIDGLHEADAEGDNQLIAEDGKPRTITGTSNLPDDITLYGSDPNAYAGRD